MAISWSNSHSMSSAWRTDITLKLKRDYLLLFMLAQSFFCMVNKQCIFTNHMEQESVQSFVLLARPTNLLCPDRNIQQFPFVYFAWSPRYRSIYHNMFANTKDYTLRMVSTINKTLFFN